MNGQNQRHGMPPANYATDEVRIEYQTRYVAFHSDK